MLCGCVCSVVSRIEPASTYTPCPCCGDGVCDATASTGDADKANALTHVITVYMVVPV